MTESLSEFLLSASGIMSLDIFIYGFVVPLLATHLAGLAAVWLGLQPAQEILLAIQFVFLLFCLVQLLSLEVKFWNKLYTLDESWLTLLDVRGFYNGFCLAYYVIALVHKVQNMTKLGPSTKDNYWGEGVGEILCERFNRVCYYPNWLEFIGHPYGYLWTESKSPERAATEFVIIMSHMFMEIAKLLYLSTISNYVTSMRVWNNYLGRRLDNQRNNNNEQADHQNIADPDEIGVQ